MKVVRRSVWHIHKLLTSSASPGKIKGIFPKCWPLLAISYRFGSLGAFSNIETANPFVKFSHDVVCLLIV